ncbi:MAG: hypothetical protein ACO27F_08220, partial [Beijerinckiaceae bacterium]
MSFDTTSACGNWPSARPHDHTWLPWRSGDERPSTTAFTKGGIPIRRCPCGVFEHEHESLSVLNGMLERGEVHIRGEAYEQVWTDEPLEFRSD